MSLKLAEKWETVKGRRHEHLLWNVITFKLVDRGLALPDDAMPF